MTTTVLVVDDDVSVVASLALLLKQNGFECLNAADPERALAAPAVAGATFQVAGATFSR